jgi:hypothetical protein
LPLIARYVKRAHQEGFERFRTFLGDPLDPRRATVHDNALAFYPRYCEKITLQGFFGEIVAGLLAELYFPHMSRWRVPAFCFYAHELLFQELVRAARTEDKPRRALGHFGDDCLAFVLTPDQSSVLRILICEAKCTTDHRASLIQKAHAKLGEQPIDVTTIWLQHVIESLQMSSDPESTRWVPLLKQFKDSLRFDEQFRDDLVSYTHGRRPVAPNETWIDKTTPNTHYRASRSLEVFEVHFVDVEALISDIYATAYP